MKTICLFGISNSGKSTSLLLLAENIYKNKKARIFYGDYPSNKKDILVGFEFDGMKVGIGSAGDTPNQVIYNLEKLSEAGCNVIVIAARSKGDGHKAIYAKCNKHELIWLRQRDVWRERNTSEGGDLEKSGLVDLSNQQSVDLLLASIKL